MVVWLWKFALMDATEISVLKMVFPKVKIMGLAGIIFTGGLFGSSCDSGNQQNYSSVMTTRQNGPTEVYFYWDRRKGSGPDYPGTDVYVLSSRELINSEELWDALKSPYGGLTEEAFFPESFVRRLEEGDNREIYSKLNDRFFLKEAMPDEEFRELMSNPHKLKEFRDEWYSRQRK